MDWTNIITAAVGIFAGAGFWAWIKAREDKRKTPYDMLKDLLVEQREFLEEKEEELRKEKRESAEKSVVIAKSQFCQHKYNDASIVCPVDKANMERLEQKCTTCELNKEADKGGQKADKKDED